MAQGKVLKLTSRLRGLDSLRGMAALSVVLFHYTFGYTEVVGKHMPGLDLIATNGHFGIYLFFIISGFVIFMTLERSAKAADFSVSRFARLWPPYLVCAGLTSLLIVGLDFNPNHLTLGDALLNVLMMNKLLGNISIDPSYWTLTYEVLFYAGAAMIFFGLKIKRIEWPCLAWLGLAFVARVSSFNENHQRLGVLLGVDFCHLFVLGMMIYLVSQRRNSWLTTSTAILAFAMTLAIRVCRCRLRFARDYVLLRGALLSPEAKPSLGDLLSILPPRERYALEPVRPLSIYPWQGRVRSRVAATPCHQAEW